jgi:beta-N-acetylhexosaminidase
MSMAERVGQLLMVDCPSTSVGPDTVIAIGRYHVGSVILDHTSFLTPQQTSTIVTLLAQRASPNVGLFVATDQEGGQVQRLLGPGFTTIPSAVQQGMLAPATLHREAQQWGAELHAAGVNVNLAPVLDTVPSGFGPNPPVGDLNREYGHDPAAVSSHGNAVAQGLQAAGVAATVKHFPGLGRVSGNTDLTAGVLDNVTTRHDPYLAPFADAIRQGVGFVMISTAIYTKIDRDQPAAFSPTIVTGMLRGDLRFRGVIISDDVGISKQLSGTSVADRAVKFIAAGGDIVLTVDATQAPTMTAALLARAKRDPKFTRQVDAAALVVLQAKQAQGLLR